MSPSVGGPDFEELLRSEEEKLFGCVHCGFCLPVCPTYTRLGDEADSPRGRLHLMRALVEGRIDAAEEAYQIHIDRCLGCRACETVCPSGVQYGQLLEGARSAALGARPSRLSTRILLKIFASPLARTPVLLLGRLARGSGLAALAVKVLPPWAPLRTPRLAMAMLAASGPARLPKTDTPARLPEGDRESRPNPSTEASGAMTGPEIGVLDGCVQAGLFSRVNDATVRTLRVNGCTVRDVPQQGCCGALHAHAGHLEAAKELARSNIRAFEQTDLDLIAVNAAGCGAAMREYGHLLETDGEYADRASAFASKVRDVSEILAELGPRSGAPIPLRATYDAPCHLHHAQRVTTAPFEVMAAIPDLELVPLRGAEECCGGAGIYAVTHPELGGSIGSDKVDAVEASEAALVATGNPGCMMQIGAGLRLRGSSIQVVHPVELLDESYSRAGYYLPDAAR